MLIQQNEIKRIFPNPRKQFEDQNLKITEVINVQKCRETDNIADTENNDNNVDKKTKRLKELEKLISIEDRKGSL